MHEEVEYFHLSKFICFFKSVENTYIFCCSSDLETDVFYNVSFRKIALVNKLESDCWSSCCRIIQWCRQPKILGSKMFDLRRATVFLFGTPFLKA